MSVMGVATTITTIAAVIGIRETVVAHPATRDNSNTAHCVNAMTPLSRRDHVLANVEVFTLRLTAVVTTATTTAAVTGTVVTAVVQPVTRGSGFIVSSASVSILNSRRATSAPDRKEGVYSHHGWVTVGVTTRTTTAPVIGTRVTVAGLLATNVSTTTAKSADAATQQRRRKVVQRAVIVVPRITSGINDAMTRTTTADATGTAVIAAAKVATRDSLTIVKSANVWTPQKVPRTVVPGPARPKRGKVMGAATMGTTTVAVTGMVVTAVAKAVTSINFLIARNVNAKIPRKRKRSARRSINALCLHTTEMDVAMMETTTAAAIGTMVIAAGSPTINSNLPTAKTNATVWIRLTRRIKIQRNAMDIAEVRTTKVMVTAMTATTTAVVNMTVVTVAARKVKNNFSTAKSASAWTRPKTRRSKALDAVESPN